MNTKTKILLAAGVFVVVFLMNKEKIKKMVLNLDKWTKKRVETLHPSLRSEVKKIFATATKETGVVFRLTSGYRSFDEQNILYAKGRTTKGPKVTNAVGGRSYHNYGLAFDVVPIIDGKAVWNNIDLFRKFANVAKRYGWEWGGDWRSFKDYPHFQKTFGLTTSQLYNDLQSNGTKYPQTLIT